MITKLKSLKNWPTALAEEQAKLANKQPGTNGHQEQQRLETDRPKKVTDKDLAAVKDYPELMSLLTQIFTKYAKNRVEMEATIVEEFAESIHLVLMQ